jgi:hypothetical protein
MGPDFGSILRRNAGANNDERKMDHMEWTRSDTLALAASSCTSCRGLGLMYGRGGRSRPCNCVLRAIFRACYARFRQCVTKEKHMSRVSLHFTRGADRRRTWGRKDEEYVADFILVSRRTLAPEEYALFKYHFLLGADWKMCTRRLKIDRGTFFHAVYRIQQKLGRVFRELEPYGLYPVSEYFADTINPAEPVGGRPSPAASHQLRPPLERAA